MHLRRRIAVVDTEHIQAILTSREDGLVYLDDEAYELELKKGGTERTLKIWGSPVSEACLECGYCAVRSHFLRILCAVVSNVWRLGMELQQSTGELGPMKRLALGARG